MATTPYPRRLLVVSRNDAAADELILLLRRMGQYVRHCTETAQAVEAARQLRPDIAFVDLDDGGEEVALRLRADPPLRSLLIVGMGSTKELHTALDEHAKKPLTADFVRALLDRPGPAAR